MREKQYIFESFNSVADFINTLGSRPTKEGWGHLTSQEKGDRWTTTNDYEEATSLALYGDRKASEKVAKSLKKIKAQSPCTEERATAKVRRTVAGSRPCVPAAIQGHPCSMYRRSIVKVSKPVVTVYYSISMHGGTSAETLVEAGAKVAQAIQTVERSGVRVNLYAGNTSCTSSQSIGCFVRIKDSAKDFDLLRMAYPIVNPSFFRRHWFRWAETKSELKTGEWQFGYGRPLERREEEETLQKMHNSLIKCDFLFTTSNVLSMTADELAETILGRRK